MSKTYKVPKPFTRRPIKPVERHKDRKNDYRRQEKHKRPELPLED